jgi:hypothetical protein
MAEPDVKELSLQVMALMAVVGALAKQMKVDTDSVVAFADAATAPLDAATQSSVRAKVAEMARMYNGRA